MDRLDPRVRFSLERTLLSWIRTSIALMGFGFLVARFSPSFDGPKESLDISLGIGIALILLGIFVNLAANHSFNRNIKLLQAGESLQEGLWSMGKILSILISLLSFGMVLHLLYN